MEAYTGFAEVYDKFMDNVPYAEWCKAVVGYLREYGIEDGLVLDLCCGTGTLTRMLAEHGYDMIGVDYSADMLAIAREKEYTSEEDYYGDVDDGTGGGDDKNPGNTPGILYLLQDAREFELYGTVRAIVSACDSLNYITEAGDLKHIFSLVHNYLDFDGIFIFDLNTPYKYEALLSDNTFAESRGDCSFIWENTYDEESGINQYDLTIFVRAGEDEDCMRTDEDGNESACDNDDAGESENLSTDGDADDEREYSDMGDLFLRYREIHYQKSYNISDVEDMLAEAGMELVAVYDAYTHDAPRHDCERVTIIARRPGEVPACM